MRISLFFSVRIEHSLEACSPSPPSHYVPLPSLPPSLPPPSHLLYRHGRIPLPRVLPLHPRLPPQPLRLHVFLRPPRQMPAAPRSDGVPNFVRLPPRRLLRLPLRSVLCPAPPSNPRTPSLLLHRLHQHTNAHPFPSRCPRKCHARSGENYHLLAF